MTVAIVGARGFVGTRLQEHFAKKGLVVIPLDRRDTASKDVLKAKLEGADVVINLAGATIIHRWSKAYKKLLYSSRIDTTNLLVEVMQELDKTPSLFISTSAVGRYSAGGTYSEYDEKYSDNYLGTVTRDWENAALKAQNLTRTVVYRLGVILGKNGGMLTKVLTPFKFGVGGRLGSGLQGFSWVHMGDVVAAVDFAIENESCKGVYNLTSPIPVTNLEFTKALGSVLKRPTFMTVPSFAIKLLYGEGSIVMLDGQLVVPKRLIDEGFRFKYEKIKDALEEAVA